MKNHLLKYLILCLSLSLPTFMFAQPSKSEVQKEKETEIALVKETLKKWTETYEKFGKTKSVKSMMDFYTKDYDVNRSSYKITGTIERDKSNYEKLEALFERMTQLEDLKTSYKIKDIYKIDVVLSTQIAYVVFEADFSLKDGDNLVAKGTEVQTMIFKKIDKEWKIAMADVLNIVDEQAKDICGCTIFASGDRQYISRVQLPTGKQYQEKLDNFVFQYKQDGSTHINVNGESYNWMSNKDIYYAYDDVSKRKLLGTEKNEKRVILAILSNHIYKYSCRKIRPNTEVDKK